MIDEGSGILIRLSGSGQTVADPADDVRGRPVLDESGARLGAVDDLLVDAGRRRIRFLRVVRGGFLGWRATSCYVPAAAVVHAGAVVLVQTSGEPAPATTTSGYDPRLGPEPDDVGAGRIGYAPYWLSGYHPPVHRVRRRTR